MGTFRVEIEVGDREGQRYERVTVLVDTGATYTSVPRPLLESLGIVPHGRATFVLADERQVQLDIGRARVRVDGQDELTLVVFAEAGTEPLLGAYALEGLLLAADPVRRRLVPVPGLLKAAGARPARAPCAQPMQGALTR